MADALSQADVDNILDGTADASTGERKKDVIRFDFRHPPRIARDRRATLEGIYGRFASILQGYLSSRLRVPTDVVISGVEQATFAEFIFSLSAPCAAIVFELEEGRPGQGILDLGTDLGYHLIDRLFGGPGDVIDMNRPMTTLEQHVIKGIADRMLAAFGEAWEDTLSFQPRYTGFESTPDALNMVDRDDNVLVANLEIRSGQFTGLITICIPLHALEPFLQEKPAQTRTNTLPDSERAAVRTRLETGLRSATLDLTVRFPNFRLRARDLTALRVGQVIHTGHHLDVPVELMVRGRRRFTGTLGQFHRSIGFQIAGVEIDPEHDPNLRAPRGRVL